jgi:hypothetical protein
VDRAGLPPPPARRATDSAAIAATVAVTNQALKAHAFPLLARHPDGITAPGTNGGGRSGGVHFISLTFT